MAENNTTASEHPSSAMGFLDHLEELRRRLLKSVFAVVVLSMAAYYVSDRLVEFIKIPLGGQIQLYNIQVTGSFYAYLKISVIAGILTALPIIFYQMWMFVSPGLYKREKLVILPLVLVSTLLFAVGGGFCFLIVLPMAFSFLIGFSGDTIVNTITIGSYISFVGLLLLAFGFGFQLPVLAYFLGKLGMVSHQFLAKGRRYAIVGILIVAAIITPPDVFTQLILAVPLYILYEISILVVRATGKRKEGEAAASRLAVHIFWLTTAYFTVALTQTALIIANDRIFQGENRAITSVQSVLYGLHYPAVIARDWLLGMIDLSYAGVDWVSLALFGFIQWLLVYMVARMAWTMLKRDKTASDQTIQDSNSGQ